MKPVVKTSELDLIDKIGLDAAIFLRFTRMCRNIFLVLTLLGCAIMIPINVSKSNSKNSVDLSTFSLMTPLSVYNNPLWTHVACAWAFDIIVAYFLWSNYRVVRDLRQRYFQSEEYQKSLHARTVLVSFPPLPE